MSPVVVVTLGYVLMQLGVIAPYMGILGVGSMPSYSWHPQWFFKCRYL